MSQWIKPSRASSALVGLMALGLGSVFAIRVAAAGTIVYDAPTDREIRPEPALPKMGPAGSSLKDPTFGSLILRVTDPATLPAHPHSAYRTPAGSFVQAWSADSRRFYVRSDAGLLLFEFDPARFTAKAAGTLPLEGAAFSGLTNDLVYGTRDRTLVAYSIATRTSSLVLDLDTVVPNYPDYQYAVSVSGDDSKFAISFAGIQDTYRYLLWYDRASGAKQLLDLRNSTLNGRRAPIRFPAGAGIHSQDIDRSGLYVGFDGPGVPGRNGCFWDTSTGTFTPQTNRWSGHGALGFGYRVNQSGIQVAGTSDGRGFTIRRLSSVNDDLRQLIDPPPSPPYAWTYGGHWSWGSARPDVLNPVVGTFYRDPDTRAWGLWDGEVVAVRTDGKASTVWRFAHHRSVFDGKDFWDSPRGNVSPDGRWFIFTSNWGKSLGKTAPGASRQDVFLVALKQKEQ